MLFIQPRNPPFQVSCSDDDYCVACDDFITFKFVRATDFFAAIDSAASIRRQFANSLKRRLNGEVTPSTELTKSIVSFVRQGTEYM